MQKLLRRIERMLRKKVEWKHVKGLSRWAFWGIILAVIFGAGFFFYLAKGLPSLGEIANHRVPESTKIYDKTGTILLYEVSSGEKRTVVPFAEIPQHLKDATLATENNEFYSEPAFSWKGILRSVFKNIVGGDLTGQGGSTITQQLARNAFLTLDKTWTRKIRELILAVQLDRYYTKDKIFELYLNEVAYGPQIYGVEAASQAYFNKPVSDVTLAEAAVLAALPQAPSRYSPWGNHVDLLMARQRYVLSRMEETGRITEGERDAALSQRVVFATQDPLGIKAPHFVLAVQDYLLEKYGEDAVREGGLKVRTTLDWELQQVAERVVLEGAESNERLYGGNNAALVAEDPSSGQVLALVGSRNYFDKERQGSYNVATQGLRQPGSALKPFVYLAGFTKGYTPDTVLFDVPTEFSANNACPATPNYKSNDSRCFHPQNFSGTFDGPVSLRRALAHSINVPAVKMLYLAGRKNSIELLQSFGLTTLDDPNRYGLSLVLGGGEVRLIDLVKAYSVLAEDGLLRDQSLILEVRDKDGKLLEEFKPRETRVIDAQYVRMVNDILSDTQARAGLFQSSLGLTMFDGHDVAMKTGTTNDYRDAWTLGYTPSIVVGVWAGNNNNKEMHRQGSSILAAVPIWSKFMREALQKVPGEAFPQPEPVTPSKPILAGNYAPNGEVHTILYWVNPEDPDGPPPSNPARDPQFEKWEFAVRKWSGNNPLPGTSTSTDPNASSTDPNLPPGTGSGTEATTSPPGPPFDPFIPPVFLQ